MYGRRVCRAQGPEDIVFDNVLGRDVLQFVLHFHQEPSAPVDRISGPVG